MANLILSNCYPKTIFSVDNWRGIGQATKADMFLINEVCETYIVHSMTVKKFLEAVRLGLDLTTTGVFKQLMLACPKCEGKGKTDWISETVDKTSSNKYYPNLVLNFTRDKSNECWKKQFRFENDRLDLYLSKAHIEEPYKFCDKCLGTGLFFKDLSMESITV